MSLRLDEPISDDWLRAAGFKWSQVDRQPSRHWILWLGDCVNLDADAKRIAFTDSQDLGIEIAAAGWTGQTGVSFYEGSWHCWLRADTAGLYHRFLHVRHLRYTREIVHMVEGLTGQAWDVANNVYGSMRHPKHAEMFRAEADRLDRKSVTQRAKWSAAEKDESRTRPLAEHLNHAIESGKVK